VDDARINEIAAELDHSFPPEGAKADWRWMELVANKRALIRLAVELLYAATEPLAPGREFTKRNWDYLWIKGRRNDDGHPDICRIARTEDVELPAPPKPTWKERSVGILSGIFVLGLVLFFLASSAIGCVTIIREL
jgi:hypothetical protein